MSQIFLEADDEITGVIEKLKNADASKVTFVIPKDALILQSVVNVRLLKRAADSIKKTIEIETTDAVGAGVARAAGILANGTFDTAKVIETVVEDTVNPPEPVVIPAISEPEPTVPAKPAVVPNKHLELAVPLLKFKPKLWLIGVGVLFAIGLYLYLALSTQAVISLTPKTTATVAGADLKVQDKATTTPATGVVAGELIAVSKNKTAKFATSGTKEVGESAKGKVRLTNNTGSSIQLAKGSKLILDKNDKRYLLDAAQTVIPFGTVQNVSVTAESMGEDYNQSTTGNNLTIPGFTTDKAYALNTSTFTGGTKKTIKTPTQNDIDTHTAELTAEVVAQADTEFKAKANHGKLLDTAIVRKTITKATPEKDQEAPDGQFELSVTFSESVLLFEEKEIIQSLIASAGVKLPAGQTVYGAKDGSLVYAVPSLPTDSQLSLKVSATLLTGELIDPDGIKQKLGGKDEKTVRKILSQEVGLSSFSITTKPNWYHVVPKDPKRITIKIETSGQ